MLVTATVALVAPTLRGESGHACEQAPLLDPTAKFITPGVRVQKARTTALVDCTPTAGSDCSLGFILKNATGAYWATGAGHCFGNVTGTNNLFAYHPEFGAWGKVEYSLQNRTHGPAPSDIALIRIFPWYQDNVDPAVPVFGGPTGLVPANESAPASGTVAHYGMPVVPGTPVGVPRVGILINWTSTHWHCTCADYHGDSGSPHLDMTTGRALGLLFSSDPQVWVGVVIPPEEINGTRTVRAFGPMFANELDHVKAQNAAWSSLSLATANLTALGQAIVDQAP